MPFSIIIPVHNCAGYLENCLESVLRAGIGDSEIILVDDGSEDGSREICDRYSSNYAFVSCFHINHDGVAAARNFGIEKSTGDYLLFVDADDEWDSAFKLADLQNETARQNADLFVLGYRIRTCAGGVVRDDKVHWPCETFRDWRDSKEKFLSYFNGGGMFPCWNKAFSREVILKNGIRFHQQQMEDFRFVLEYLNVAGRVSFLSMAPYIYMKRGERSLTSTLHQGMLEEYNHCHSLFLSLFDKEQEALIHQIMVPQYMATVYKCLNSDDRELSRSLLDSLKHNALAAESLKEYEPATPSDRFSAMLMRKGLFGGLNCYRQSLDTLKRLLSI